MRILECRGRVWKNHTAKSLIYAECQSTGLKMGNEENSKSMFQIENFTTFPPFPVCCGAIMWLLRMEIASRSASVAGCYGWNDAGLWVFLKFSGWEAQESRWKGSRWRMRQMGEKQGTITIYPPQGSCRILWFGKHAKLWWLR